MLKTVSREEMYLICKQMQTEALKGLKAYHVSSNVMTITNEMIDLLDQMPQLKLAVKLEDLMKEIHNHLHNH